MKIGIVGRGMKLISVMGLSLFFSGMALAQSETPSPSSTTSSYSATPRAVKLRTGTWRGGGGVGFLAETPDDTAFAVNLNADRFLSENVSIGPLVQFAFTSDLFQYGLSGQAKYWMDLGGAGDRTKIFLQGGIGFVHADFRQDDTSWLVPLGMGIEHTLDSGVGLYGTFLLNLTDLNTGGGTSADVMPGVTFGVQF